MSESKEGILFSHRDTRRFTTDTTLKDNNVHKSKKKIEFKGGCNHPRNEIISVSEKRNTKMVEN